MLGKVKRIRSRDGSEFDCYLVSPEAEDLTPAVVIASAIHGVDDDIRWIADCLAAQGFIVAAPDLFWRSIPGPLPRDDHRAVRRSQPRPELIKLGEDDMADTLTYLCTLPNFNGRAAAMGFCYGGPYAILGPRRLGYDAGVSCHGSQMMDYLPELESVRQPVCIIWGDKDHLAPQPVLDAYRALAARKKNVEVDVFPGIEHGYMMKDAKAYDGKTYDFSMQRALSILKGLV